MENLQIQNLFSTPVAIIDLSEEDQYKINSEIESHMDQYEFDYICVHGKNGGYHNRPKRTIEYLIDKYDLKILRETIFEQVNNYVTTINGRSLSDLKLKLSCMHSWLTKSDFNSYFGVHHHSHLGVSGVYYYKVNDNCDSIYLKPHDRCPEISPIYKFHRKDAHEIEVKNGRMILFPGWLDHGTHTKTGDHDRMTVGFDLHFREEDRDYRGK